MLRINLSTRPFYNERLVFAALVALGVLAVMVVLWDGVRLTTLLRQQRTLAAAAAADESRAIEVSNAAAELQRTTGPTEIAQLRDAAQEANLLLDRRAFSWTEFFNRVEETLPSDVMLTSLRPEVDEAGIEVAIGIVGRDVAAIDRFIGALEATGAFAEVLSREEEITEDGDYRAVLLGRYIEPVPTTEIDNADEESDGERQSLYDLLDLEPRP